MCFRSFVIGVVMKIVCLLHGCWDALSYLESNSRTLVINCSILTVHTGVPLFLVLLALIAWVIFWDYDTRVPTSTVVTVISVITLAFALVHLMYKWNEYLQEV